MMCNNVTVTLSPVCQILWCHGLYHSSHFPLWWPEPVLVFCRNMASLAVCCHAERFLIFVNNHLIEVFLSLTTTVIIPGNMIIIFRWSYANVNIIINIIWIFCHLIPLSPAHWPLMKMYSDLFSLSVRLSASRSTYLSFSSFQPAVEGLQCAVLKSARQPASHW